MGQMPERWHGMDRAAYTLVLEGRVGAVFGNTELVAEEGDLVFKPRGEWHTFWNPDDTPARVLEMISPGGLERLFRAIERGLSDEEFEQFVGEVGCEVDLDRTMPIIERHGLTFG